MRDGQFFDCKVEEYEGWFRSKSKLLKPELDAARLLLPEIGQGKDQE